MVVGTDELCSLSGRDVHDFNSRPQRVDPVEFVTHPVHGYVLYITVIHKYTRYLLNILSIKLERYIAALGKTGVLFIKGCSGSQVYSKPHLKDIIV